MTAIHWESRVGDGGKIWSSDNLNVFGLVLYLDECKVIAEELWPSKWVEGPAEKWIPVLLQVCETLVYNSGSIRWY